MNMHEKHKSFTADLFLCLEHSYFYYFKDKLVNFYLEFLLAGLKGNTDFGHVYHLENIENPDKQSLHFDEI